MSVAPRSTAKPAWRCRQGGQAHPRGTIVRVSAVAICAFRAWDAAAGLALQRSSESDAILARDRLTGRVLDSYHDRVIPPSVEPWSRADPQRLAAVRGVLTDIDDTLTTAGAIPMGVVAALAALGEAGLPVIAVTGRP